VDLLWVNTRARCPVCHPCNVWDMETFSPVLHCLDRPKIVSAFESLQKAWLVRLKCRTNKFSAALTAAIPETRIKSANRTAQQATFPNAPTFEIFLGLPEFRQAKSSVPAMANKPAGIQHWP